jgi:hypothetical protein
MPFEINVINPSNELIARISHIAKKVEDVHLIIDTEDEYRLSGREVARFIALSIAAGIIGNTAYDASKGIIAEVIEAVGEELSRTEGGVTVIVRGVQFTISEMDSAKEIIQDMLHDAQAEDEK